MDIIKKMKKDIKRDEITFDNLDREFAFIQGYLVALKKSLPPIIILKAIRGESVFDSDFD